MGQLKGFRELSKSAGREQEPPDRAVEILETELRQEVQRAGLGPGRSLEDVAVDVLDRYRNSADGLPSIPPDLDAVTAMVARVSGVGPIQDLLDDPAVEEIWINGAGKVFAAASGENRAIACDLSENQIEELVQRLIGHSGRRVDRSSPFVDARLSDGSRLHAAIPPITHEWTVNIRKFVGVRANQLKELADSASLSEPAARFLDAAVKAGLNLVVAGAVGAGKTTLLNCLASAIPPRERVITCEEVFELQVGLDDVVGMQCRAANLEGEGEIPLRQLVKEALRMRPDRIIVGEVRGAEALDMLLAMNAGCAAMTSVHANSARDALRKLITLPLLAGENVSRDFVEPTVAACVDLVIFCSRDRSAGTRVVDEILAITEQVADEGISASPIFLRGDSGLCWTGEYPRSRHRIAALGINLGELLGDAEADPRWA